MKPVGKALNVLSAAVAAALLLSFLALGAGPLPALGTALDPGAGVWNAAADARPVRTEALHLPGLHGPVTVSFDAAGVPAVHAGSDEDGFTAQGYLHAKFRVTQLDLERRMAQGRLAELTGPAAVESDTFQLQSGLLRTARAEWATTSPDSPAGRALTAYSRGVNAQLEERRRNGDWPAVFALAGVHPADWTPVDSLSVQALLTQNMSYGTSPLAYALLRDSLGERRTMDWFPVLPGNDQRPYDTGPYRSLGLDPLPAAGNANAAVPADASPPADASSPAVPPSAATSAASAPTAAAASVTAAADILGRFQRLPATGIDVYSHSNAWAANGPAVAGARSILAGDPHLQLTLPSFWYQMALSSPGTTVTGASLVALPGILIGRNAHLSWTMTDVQNQSTLFYVERTDPQRPGEYYWQGAWRRMEQVHYTIPVRGGSPVPLTVDLTVHGPVMNQAGQTTSVSWMGNYPSASLAAVLAINKAAGQDGFRSALAGWRAPTLNFTYADDQGNIGVQAAGYFPQVKAGQPWFPLPGTGEYDIAGTIPVAALPQVHNPAGHVVATANQRPVTGDYPYYVGTTMAAYDAGYRAQRIYQVLEGRSAPLTADDFAALQGDVTDPLAARSVPALRTALQGVALDRVQQKALDQLTGWDHRMTTSAAGATIWWTFWSDYLSVVFQPWWDAAKVPVDKDSPKLDITPTRASLDQDLQAWTLHDPGNPAFTPPGGPPGDAPTAMRTAFTRAVTELTAKLGDDPATWGWGRVHTREIPSMLDVSALGEGPTPADGDRFTVNAAEGGLNSSFGPSWRMVVAWTGDGQADARAIYPGGQSENPESPWYRTFGADWWNGRLRPLRTAEDGAPSVAVWTLEEER
ncbi:penicillin acylase family protein [Kitasatospora sp. NPDC096128]|uniref:penicillin acylase family protein n=1 Tax=Kitasatospora sp. NPDC096128 TaxID=3155547 RepID=UPI0033258989